LRVDCPTGWAARFPERDRVTMARETTVTKEQLAALAAADDAAAAAGIEAENAEPQETPDGGEGAAEKAADAGETTESAVAAYVYPAEFRALHRMSDGRLHIRGTYHAATENEPWNAADTWIDAKLHLRTIQSVVYADGAIAEYRPWMSPGCVITDTNEPDLLNAARTLGHAGDTNTLLTVDGNAGAFQLHIRGFGDQANVIRQKIHRRDVLRELVRPMRGQGSGAGEAAKAAADAGATFDSEMAPDLIEMEWPAEKIAAKRAAFVEKMVAARKARIDAENAARDKKKAGNGGLAPKTAEEMAAQLTAADEKAAAAAAADRAAAEGQGQS
jgi:hypothetical protein